MSLTIYIELVDWNGQIFHEDKKDQIPNLLLAQTRLGIQAENGVYLTQPFEGLLK